MEKISSRSFRRKKLYRGFSTYNYQQNRSHRVFDVEAVKIDLLNHIYTRKGSRLNMPTFGTSVPDLIMEQLDEVMIDDLENELRTVVNYDPRVEFADNASFLITALPDQNTIIAAMKLRFIELDYVDTLTLNIQFNN